MADSDTFQFNFIFLVGAAIISSICILYVLLDFCINQKSREIPTRLMVARTIFNYVAMLVVLIVINLQPESIRQHDSPACQAQGAIFLFSLYMATAYYAIICWELQITLRDPFRTPSSGSVFNHITIVLICFFVVLGVSLSNSFAFRDEFEICFMRKRQKHTKLNLLNWCVIYIPLFLICIGGFIATVWIAKRLKSGINRDTYELRLVALKQQTAIIILFTFNYIFQGFCWMILFSEATQNINQIGPYLLSSFCLIACIFDAITWTVRKCIKKLPFISSSIYGSFVIQPDHDQFSNSKVKTISAALRKEVITCIIDGISRADHSNASTSSLVELALLNNNNNNNKNTNKKQSLSKANETLLRLSQYYPIKLDDKCSANIIEEYEIDPIQANKVQAVFRNYGAKIFSYLRSIYGVTDEEYYNSILPIKDVSKVSLELCSNFSEGRSGAFLFFTADRKYLIKTLVKREAQLLLDTLKRYVAYMTGNKHKTYLLKYYGLHSIRMYGHSIYFVVNKNIFSDMEQDPDEKYDIKGSWIDRNTKHRIEDKKVMKDKDLKEPLRVNKLVAVGVYRQLQKDVEFLSELNIMDYSLLLGVYYTKKQISNQQDNDVDHNVNVYDGDIKYDEFESDNNNNHNSILNAEVAEDVGKYCIGIIDMLQNWDLNKKAERFLKSCIRCKDKNGISCIPPIPYSERFLVKMQEIGIGYNSVN